MTLRTLRWLTIVIPVVLAAMFLASQRTLWHPLFVTWPGFFIELAALAVEASVFSMVVFRIVARLEGRIISQNHDLARLNLRAENQAQRLRGLHQASIALTGELELEERLQQIVDLSREIAEAQYAALMVMDENRGTQQLLTSGLSVEENAEMQESGVYLSSKDDFASQYDCIFKGRSSHCTTFEYSNPHVPSYGVHDISRIGSSPKKLKEIVDAGIFELDKILSHIRLSEKQERQIDVYKSSEVLIKTRPKKPDSKNIANETTSFP